MKILKILKEEWDHDDLRHWAKFTGRGNTLVINITKNKKGGDSEFAKIASDTGKYNITSVDPDGGWNPSFETKDGKTFFLKNIKFDVITGLKPGKF